MGFQTGNVSYQPRPTEEKGFFIGSRSRYVVECKLTGVVVKVVQVQRVVIPRRGEILVHRHGEHGDVLVEVVAVFEAADKLVQGDVQTTAREIAVVGEGVDAGTGTATCERW